MDALRSTIIQGETFSASKSISEDSTHNVKLNLVITNFTKYGLISPITVCHHGQIPCPAIPVGAGKMEMMVIHKTPYTPRGTEGTVSWKISPAKRIIVMWSAPYKFALFNNELAVGIIGVQSHDNSTHWFDRMYSNNGSGPFARAKFGLNGYTQSIKYTDGEFGIEALMGTSHRAEARISVYPLKVENLAKNVNSVTQETLDENFEQN